MPIPLPIVNLEDMIVGDPHKDMRVLGNMPIEEYNKYRGEWVAIVDAKIVAHGKDPRRVNREGYRIGKGLPFMDYVYKDDTEVPLAYARPKKW